MCSAPQLKVGNRLLAVFYTVQDQPALVTPKFVAVSTITCTDSVPMATISAGTLESRCYVGPPVVSPHSGPIMSSALFQFILVLSSPKESLRKCCVVQRLSPCGLFLLAGRFV